jgi:DNA-binding GntR family transcriptional regulator
MFEALRELETLCAGFAAERATSAECTNLARINKALLAVVRAGDAQRYHEINESFHAAIYAGAHNAYLAKLALETRSRIAPFSRAQFRKFGRLAKSHSEHEVILEAILKRDRNGAAAAMRKHIAKVHDTYTGNHLAT